MNPASGALRLQINGESHTVSAALTLADLIGGLALPSQATLVEHNGRALLREEWSGLKLADGDRLEILRIVAGG